MSSIDKSLKLVIDNASINQDESFELSRLCGSLLNGSDEDCEGARRLLIRVLDNWDKLPQLHHVIWADLIEAAGFYPYLAKEDRASLLSSTSQVIRNEYHLSKGFEGVYFHEEQKQAADLLAAGKNLIVSAPTSFGKSLLIHEVVASDKFDNIVIIQPTLALIDETRKKIQEYAGEYKIVSRTTQEKSDSKNIFLFTAERVMEYQQFPEKIDFFVIDEFYKLSYARNDERVDALNNAAYKLLNIGNPQFYLLGPNINGVSEEFLARYNASFIKTKYSLVDSESVDQYTKVYSNDDERMSALFHLLNSEIKDDEQTIIYCSSPGRARKLAAAYMTYLDEQGVAMIGDVPLCKWMEQYIHPNWTLIDCIRYGIGVHDASLPRHVSATIIDLFNTGKIKWLFCTSTIIEGVNTTAKNVIYFDNNKGGDEVDFFDYSNIKGRAGRMMVHYVGSIYNFYKPPTAEEIKIDIPFIDQADISDELLINLDKKDVKESTSEQYLKIERIPPKLRRAIAKNGLSVEGQLAILDQLYKGLRAPAQRQLIIWHGTSPSYDQLAYIFGLCWPRFKKKNDGFVLSYKQLAYFLNLYTKSGVQGMITKLVSEGKTVDRAIKEVLGFQRYWIEYTIPKWISVVNELQTLASSEQGMVPGNYSIYIKKVENDFVPENIAYLLEIGVPRSALDKLQVTLRGVEEDNVAVFIGEHPEVLARSGLLEYEKDKLLQALNLV